MDSVLKISEISKSFEKALILDCINLNIEKNDIFGFIGLNGAGKTTLIKIILDLLDQDSGEVEIEKISRILPESRKSVFYLPEKFQPSNNLYGQEFLDFSLSFYRKKIDLNLAKELCEKFEFPFAALKKKTSTYSKGMTQKLGLLAAFLSNANLIILDEPMSGLDLKARISLKRELVLYKNLGKTIFFSSHILSDMDDICNKIAILHKSKILFNGTPQELKSIYKKENLDEAFLEIIK